MSLIKAPGQFHVFSTVDLGAPPPNAGQFTVNAFVPFRVKAIKFGFAYKITADATALMVPITADITYNNPVGLLNLYARTSGGVTTYVDGLSEDKVIKHVFTEPKDIYGGITFSYNNVITTTTMATMIIFVHMEFLGE